MSLDETLCCLVLKFRKNFIFKIFRILCYFFIGNFSNSRLGRLRESALIVHCSIFERNIWNFQQLKPDNIGIIYWNIKYLTFIYFEIKIEKWVQVWLEWTNMTEHIYSAPHHKNEVAAFHMIMVTIEVMTRNSLVDESYNSSVNDTDHWFQCQICQNRPKYRTFKWSANSMKPTVSLWGEVVSDSRHSFDAKPPPNQKLV